MSDRATNGWGEHKRLVEHRINALEEEMADQKKRANEHDVSIALLNLKASGWGAIAGFIISILTQGLVYLISLIPQN
jgi:ribulose 1,5-bisphosphate carboxylase large subunit-like protein